MSIPALILWIVSSLAIVFTFAGYLRRDEWWIRIFDFPRTQIAFILLISIGAQLFLLTVWQASDWVLTGLLLFALGYQVYKIYPYTPLVSKQLPDADNPDPEGSFSLMVSNVLMTNRKADRLMALVHQREPDLLLTLETNSWWEKELRPLEKDYPYTIPIPLDNLYGMHLYSRFPIVEKAIHYLVENKIPSIEALIQLPSGQDVRLYCLHPKPPSPTESDTAAPRDAELLLVARKISRKSEPVLICGDLNDVAWSNTTRLFQKISGLLDPRVGRGFFNTFHTHYPLFRWPLDHIFLSGHFKLIDYNRLQHIGSDHFPIFTEVFLQKEPYAKPRVPEPEAADRQRARTKIKKADPVRKKLK